MNRVIGVANQVVRQSQTTFMPRRNIMEEVVVWHEMIHDLHREKRMG